MSPIEAAIYSYLQFLVVSNRGAPAGSAFLKSIRFLDSCFQYMMYTTAAVFSTGRWLGACFVEKATSPRSGLYTFDSPCACHGKGGGPMDDARSNKACTIFRRSSNQGINIGKGGHVSLFKAMAFECKGSTLSKRRVTALPHQVSRYRTARRMFLMLATFPLDFFAKAHDISGRVRKFTSFPDPLWFDRKSCMQLHFSFIEAYFVGFSSALGAFAFKVRPCLGHHMAGFRSGLRLPAKLY